MKKIHQASRKNGNKWVRKTKWKLDTDDLIGLMVFLLVGGYVVVRALLG